MRIVKNIFFIIPVAFCFMNMQCDDDSDDYLGVCDQTTVIDESLYDSLESNNFTILGAEIQNNCLTIEFGASGCDGNSWTYQLVDSGAVAESSPEQRYLKFELLNNEACLAYFEKSISFDLTSLQITGSNKIILHIDGYESSLTYTY
ncbi:hypothetical protein L3X39_00245 [Sabulilitoribacter multivorans]|uniref:Lipocalin-like domain-containing protein n=1 Tax=Flaviramulus multivorans TaxID=1304750 RepID=A0ABS9IE86_9FLAO|nr:hypothetical protein [Flaviramulus multivorans]MCF7559049.1 hypothetical protein [Flaviramulus multivorans]